VTSPTSGSSPTSTSKDQPLTSQALTAPIVTTPLVSTQWLADHLGSDGLVIADATVLPVASQNPAAAGPAADGPATYVSGDEQYLVHGHIPGAVFADLIDEFSDRHAQFGFTRPDATQFESAAAGLGVDNDTTLVVYDNSVGQWAARLWWLFRAFGHDRVAVLDGGLRKWAAEDRPMEFGYVAARAAGPFTASERPELWADKASVSLVATGESNGSLVCGLPASEFRGDTRGHRARAGHIPRSISAPASRLVDRDTNSFLPAADLQQIFSTVTADAPAITYCAAGIAAASDALALTILGHGDVSIYDGSLNEWAADANAPLVTSP
jgi:thiosulfate/3-mercaptopyruvate sulfurtransferase